jgi:hypothetical protein
VPDSLGSVFDVTVSTASASACMNLGALGSGLGFWVSGAEAGSGVFGEVVFRRFISMVITLLMLGSGAAPMREVHG